MPIDTLTETLGQESSNKFVLKIPSPQSLNKA
jgi:hypothetical protein